MTYVYVADGTPTPPRHFPYVVPEPPPPLPPVRVIVGLGQSNVRGAADDYDRVADQYNDADVFMWNWGGHQMQKAAEPLATQDSSDAMGVLNTFAKDYAAERLPSGAKLLVVNAARGGTGFSVPSSNPGNPDLHWRRDLPADANNLATTARAELLRIMAALPAGSEIVAFVANHGSTDGTNGMGKATFKGYLQDWITWLRTELGTPTVPYLMMQMRPDLLANEERHRVIDDAQTETAAEMAHVYKVASPAGPEFYRNDTVHFNAAGVRNIGHRLHDALPAAA